MSGFAHQFPTNCQLAPPPPRVRAAPPGANLVRLVATIRLWRNRLRERQELAEMGERELHDLGLSRADILGELVKPFWRG